MSSKYLLQARGVRKSYPSHEKTLGFLVRTLLGLKSPANMTEVLKGVDLKVERGETVGIMGRNGAGKTTLLSILGNVVKPTEGTIRRHGKMAVLLGLGAGFNPQFTGRENARMFLNIQGIRGKDADDRMEAVAAFADIGHYFDMPLRTYSSGMQARLSFAAAIHVDADLIIIDETLAVGDASFRMKCYDRIRTMQQQGQTFLLVSHSQNLVANFCSRAVILEGGRKVFDGDTFEALSVFKQIRADEQEKSAVKAIKTLDGGQASGHTDPLVLEHFAMRPFSAEGGSGEELEVTAELVAHADVEAPCISYGIRNQQGIAICAYNAAGEPVVLPAMKAGERRTVHFRFAQHLLAGRYFFSATTYRVVGDTRITASLHLNVLSFEIHPHAHMTGIANLNMRIECDGAADKAALPTAKRRKA